MISKSKQSIIDQVRSLKEENAAEHGFSIRKIIESARCRQDTSGRHVIRINKGEDGTGKPATRTESKPEDGDKP